jgi:transcriptional regulator with XRE-family HTH domain
VADPFFRELGQRIARIRGERGLTQEALAARAQLSSSYIARIELGIRRPTLDALRSLAEALTVPVWLLLQDPPQTPSAQLEDLIRTARDLAPEDVRLLTRVATRLAPPARRAAAAPTSGQRPGRSPAARAAERPTDWSRPPRSRSPRRRR